MGIFGYLFDWGILRHMSGQSQTSIVVLTIAIGFTGGHHRPVYIAERLVRELSAGTPHLLIRHRDLP